MVSSGNREVTRGGDKFGRAAIEMTEQLEL